MHLHQTMCQLELALGHEHEHFPDELERMKRLLIVTARSELAKSIASPSQKRVNQ